MKTKQAIILAAGRGTRLRPLTVTNPKPFMRVANKNLLEHNLNQLKGIVEEAIIVIGYKGEKIKDFFGDNYRGIKIKYAKQSEALGTGDAAVKALSLIKEDTFLILNGDDLYFKKGIKAALEQNPSMLLKKVDNPSGFSQVLVKDGVIQKIVEKPKKKLSDLAGIGLYFANKEIFEAEIEKSKRGEYELPDYFIKYIRNGNKLYSALADNWYPVTYPWSVVKTNKMILNNLKKKNKGKKEKGAVLKGKVKIGEGTIIKSGAYIEGPVLIGKNCKIGPNCYIRGVTTIGNNCHIGNGVEIKNSVVYDNTNIAHLSYVGDSVIGKNCNFGAGTITANLRHDNKNVKSMVKEELVDTGMRKFGCATGDNVKTGIGTLIYPGRKIWANQKTKPGEKVKKDIK